MALNKILGFGTSASTEYDDATYATFAQRLTGNQPGIADPLLVNKAMHQSSAIAAGVAQFLASYQGTDIVDTLTPAQVSTAIAAAISGSFAGSFGLNGYQRLPGGLILQWAAVTTSGAGTVTWTFPIAFPTACMKVVATAAGTNIVVGIGATTNTTQVFNAFTGSTGAAAGAQNVSAFALGY